MGRKRFLMKPEPFDDDHFMNDFRWAASQRGNILADLDTCWRWDEKSVAENNYAYYRSVAVHRLSQVTFNGPIPEDKPNVLHSCSHPWCWNPAHLRPGTDRDNANDYYNELRGFNVQE